MRSISRHPISVVSTLGLFALAACDQPTSPLSSAESAVVTSAGPSGAAQAPPGVPGLVSWWPGANTKDVGGPNDGSLVNGAAITSGKIGPGFTFDGIDDYFKVPFDASLDVGAQVSIAFWMRADPGNAMSWCCQGLVTTDFYSVEISGGFHPRVGVNFFVNTGTPWTFAHTSDANGGAAVVTPGEWHHITGTYDGTKLQLYVDGQPWGNPRPLSGSIMPMRSGSFLAIGSEDGRTVCGGCIGNRYFNGQIDEVAIYSRALGVDEVYSLYRRGGNR